MHEHIGVPWNLVPKQVFGINRVPVNAQSGAGKVDRRRIKTFVKDLLRHRSNNCSVDRNEDTVVEGTSFRHPNSKRTADAIVSSTNSLRHELLTIVSDVLGVPRQQIIEQEELSSVRNQVLSSFIELGGDSALAVTLVYKLKEAGLIHHFNDSIRALDILTVDSITNLELLITDHNEFKRCKVKPNGPNGFQLPSRPSSSFSVQRSPVVERVNDVHYTIRFSACVDASPLYHNNFLFGACQGGIVQRVSLDELFREAVPSRNQIKTPGHTTQAFCYHNLGAGWKIQADLMVVTGWDDSCATASPSIVACAYDPLTENGFVVALSLDLQTVQWEQLFQRGMIKSTPILSTDARHLFVMAGTKLYVLDLHKNGTIVASTVLPASTESRPVCYHRDGSDTLVYAFSDWEVGLAIVEVMNATMMRLDVTRIPDITAPIYADLLLDTTVDATPQVVACDISGHLHVLDVNALSITSTGYTTSNGNPIFSGPVKMDADSIIFGSHDGVIRCIETNDMTKIRWQRRLCGVVYSKVCQVDATSIVACTTAGRVYRLGAESLETIADNINAEIWSDPIVFNTALSIDHRDRKCTAFGARDSKLHIIILNH
jgi:outer membrane protein assembly factor BamB